jgi:hypothetical protein
MVQMSRFAPLGRHSGATMRFPTLTKSKDLTARSTVIDRGQTCFPSGNSMSYDFLLSSSCSDIARLQAIRIFIFIGSLGQFRDRLNCQYGAPPASAR